MKNENIENKIDEKSLVTVDLNAKEILTTMHEITRKTWVIILFCAIGWVILCYNWQVKNVLFSLIGLVIIAAPSIKKYWKSGLAGMFSFHLIDYVKDNNGYKKPMINSGTVGINFVIKCIMIIFITIIGIFITVFQIFINASKYFYYNIKIKNNTKVSFAKSIWFPIVLGIISILITILVAGKMAKNVNEVNNQNLQQEKLITIN